VIEEVAGVADRSRIDCDVCIVGAGAAGITVALELEATGARICLLDAGGLAYRRRAQALLDGEVVGDSYPPLKETRFAGLGGATRIWGGWCRPLDPIDFTERSWVPNSGWPFGHDSLRPHYQRAHAICGLGEVDYDPPAWAKRVGAEHLKLAGDDVVTTMFQVSPTRFGSRYRAALAATPNIRVLLGAVALRCRAAPTSDRLEQVEVGALDGRRFAVAARLFVLATGGIENARLLLLSGPTPETSIGNARGLVGRYFTEHPFMEPGSFLPRDPAISLRFYFPARTDDMPPDANVRAALSLGRPALEREGLLNAAVFFLPAYEAHPVFTDPAVKAMLELWEKVRGRGVPGGNGDHVRRALRAPHRLVHAAWRRIAVRPGRTSSWRLRAFFEAESLHHNRVRLAAGKDALDRPLPRVEWRLSERDLASMRRVLALHDQALAGAGHGRLALAFDDTAEAWRAAAFGGKHHMGTTRMHASPSAGVVDADCRVHGVRNLYVAGSSVFPTSGFANPTLTIVALAVRLAEHLKGRLRDQEPSREARPTTTG
jgi:choline dehydrogenase-like flavoprotein